MNALLTTVPPTRPSELRKLSAAPEISVRPEAAAPPLAGDGAEESLPNPDILNRLEAICAERGLERLALRLHDLVAFVATDLAALEGEIESLPRHPRLVGQSAIHLLDHGGKRLRPMLTALASRVGEGFDARVLDLAVAVELVHTASLLHDDVVDMAEHRRGAETSRAVYGNAASIFAGDWVLIEALRRVDRCAIPGLLPSLFATIEEIIWAESLQLESRGRINADRDVYFRVVRGKTASVFRWGMAAGARAGGLDTAQCEALAEYGLDLGIAFQATDDLLDLTGDPTRTGKDLFADLREGKMTYPVIVALERAPELAPALEEVLAMPHESPLPDDLADRIVTTLRETRAVEDCLALAREHSARAVARLEILPQGQAVRALATVAEAIVNRDL